jgi:WS/DGAT/MGAT family acyltransferase
VTVDRVSSQDLMTLAVDRGGTPMHIGAVLSYGTDRPTADAVVEALSGRLDRVPRLAHRLVRSPPGCGRPVWCPDPGFAVGRHVDVAPLGAATVEDAAMEALLPPLPRDRPLWRARVLADGHRGASALVVVLHHALADGLGGLAVLAALADGAAGPLPGLAETAPGAPPPTSRELAADAWAERGRVLRRLPASVAGLRAGLRELGSRPSRAGETTLLAPTSRRRALDVVDVAVAPVVAAAHRSQASVNDLVLVAVTGAVATVLRGRGDPLAELVVSVPVSARGSDTAGKLGNAVGVLPLAVPLVDDPAVRLAAVTRQRARLGVTAPRGSSAPVLAAGFRALAAVGVFTWFVRRQRLVHTFVTHVRGPDAPVRLAGSPVVRAAPLTVQPGDVTVSFAVLSMGGRLVVSVISDPEHVPDRDLLRGALEDQLTGLVA